MAILEERTLALCLHLMLVFFIISSIATSFAELQRFEHAAKDDGSLSFLVIGDWGRRGFYNQSIVAREMGKIGEKLDIDFVVSTGDNFYEDGLKGVGDPAFEESFTKIYTAKSLQKPWYSGKYPKFCPSNGGSGLSSTPPNVLGNHDYRGDTEAQLSPLLRNFDSRWICLRSFIVNTEIAELFFVDTTPFVDDYYTDKDHTYNWRGVTPRRDYLHNLLRDLEIALKDSNAKWKFVVGHHAIRSAGHHGDTLELRKYLLPILKAYNVDFYMNGHDHCLEHFSSLDSPIQFLTSGAGSKAWRGDIKNGTQNDMKFFYDGQGFMSLQLNNSADLAEVVFYDVSGNVLHNWKLSKLPYSSF